MPLYTITIWSLNHIRTAALATKVNHSGMQYIRAWVPGYTVIMRLGYVVIEIHALHIAANTERGRWMDLDMQLD